MNNKEENDVSVRYETNERPNYTLPRDTDSRAGLKIRAQAEKNIIKIIKKRERTEHVLSVDSRVNDEPKLHTTQRQRRSMPRRRGIENGCRQRRLKAPI